MSLLKLNGFAIVVLVLLSVLSMRLRTTFRVAYLEVCPNGLAVQCVLNAEGEGNNVVTT